MTMYARLQCTKRIRLLKLQKPINRNLCLFNEIYSQTCNTYVSYLLLTIN